MPTKPNVYQLGLVQVRTRYTNEEDGDHTENVMWFSGQAAPNPLTLTQLTAIANVVDANWPNVWKQVGSASASYIGSIVTDWQSNTGLQVDTTLSLSPVPGSGNTPFPANVAALISLHAPIRYRGGHGRIYLPWIGNNVPPSGQPNHVAPALVTAMTTQMAAFQSAMASISAPNGGPWTQQLYRYRNSPNTIPPAPKEAILYPISGVTVQPLLCSQRRRLRKAAHR